MSLGLKEKRKNGEASVYYSFWVHEGIDAVDEYTYTILYKVHT